MRPTLSATQTYNYTLARWLDTKLKPLSLNRHTVTDIFEFANEIRNLEIANSDIMVSFDVSSLFTNVPLDETIQVLANRAFKNNWFDTTYDLNLTKTNLVDPLRVATKEQLFQFNGALCEQSDGVGSPVNPLLANVFMSHIQENLKREGKLPSLYRRYVNDTLTNMATASNFLDTLNKAHSSVKFTMNLSGLSAESLESNSSSVSCIDREWRLIH